MGGGGYGDPIDREPDRVSRDVANGLVSERAAAEIYGVVLNGSGVDAEATATRRLQLRGERIGRALEPALGERAEVATSGRPLGEYLQLSDGGATQCTWCARELAPAGEPWKRHATTLRSPVTKAGENRSTDDDFGLLEHCCPGCGTLLDTEVVWREDQALDDEPELPGKED